MSISWRLDRLPRQPVHAGRQNVRRCGDRVIIDGMGLTSYCASIFAPIALKYKCPGEQYLPLIDVLHLMASRGIVTTRYDEPYNPRNIINVKRAKKWLRANINRLKLNRKDNNRYLQEYGEERVMVMQNCW